MVSVYKKYVRLPLIWNNKQKPLPTLIFLKKIYNTVKTGIFFQSWPALNFYVFSQ